MALAVYDLDKTLVRRATFTPFLIFAARKIAPVRLLLLPLWIALMLGYKLGLSDRTTLKTRGMQLMLGRPSLDRLETVGRAFAEAHLARDGWNETVVAMLKADRAEGRTVIIATAAFEFYAKAFAAKLGVEHVIGTVWDGKAIIGANCYGAEKLERVLDWSGGHMPIERMVSDSFADEPLLSHAGEAVFVTNSRAKRRKADRHGWKVIRPDG